MQWPYFVIWCNGEVRSAVSTGKYSGGINAVLTINKWTSQAMFLSILILWCSFTFSSQSKLLLPPGVSSWEVFEPHWMELVKRGWCAFHCWEPVLCKNCGSGCTTGLSSNQYCEPSLGKTASEVISPFLVLLDKALSGTVPKRRGL